MASFDSIETMDSVTPENNSLSSSADLELSKLILILTSTLPYLPGREWFRLFSLCKAWKTAVINSFITARRMKCQNFLPGGPYSGPRSHHEDAWRMRQFNNLQDFFHQWLRRCKALKTLIFFDNSYGPHIRLLAADMKFIGQLPFCNTLTYIDLTGTTAPWESLFKNFVSRCVNLETLILRGTLRKIWPPTKSWNEQFLFTYFVPLTKLRYFEVKDAHWLTGRILEILPDTVETLILEQCNLNGVVVAKYIHRLVNLRTLIVDTGFSIHMAAAVLNIPNLEQLVIDGIFNDNSMNGSLTLFGGLQDRLWSTNNMRHLSTLCIGGRVRNLDLFDVKLFFDHPEVQRNLIKLELHTKSFPGYKMEPLASGLETIGKLGELRHLELSLHMGLDRFYSLILSRIALGCQKLVTLALQLGRFYKVDETSNFRITFKESEKNKAALIDIMSLPLLEDFSFLSKYSYEYELIRIVFLHSTGNIKRLRLGILEWFLLDKYPDNHNMPLLEELDLLFNAISPPDYDQAENENIIPHFIQIFGNSLKRLRVFNCGSAARDIEGVFADLAVRDYPKIDFEAKELCVYDNEPVIAGGSMDGIRLNMKSTSFAKNVKNYQGAKNKAMYNSC